MNRIDQSKLIYSGKYPLPLEAATKKSYKISIYRSKVEYATISDIEFPKLPENYYIYSYKDIPGKKHININGDKIPVLANKSVNYVGEPIFIILGPEEKILKKIKKNIKIKYQKLKETREVFFNKSITIGSVNEYFESSTKIKTGRITTPKRIIEKKLPIGAFTKKESDSFIINTSAAWPADLQYNLGSICNIEDNKIKILTPNYTGEDEESLIDTYFSSIYTTMSSYLIKKNVYHILSPEEKYLYSSNDYGLTGDWQIAFNDKNNPVAIKVKISIDCGAYPVLVEEKALRAIHGITSVYRHKNITVDINMIKSNKAPIGTINGLYLTESQYFAEMLIGKIVKNGKLNQLSWRVNNILKKGNKNNTMSIIKSELPLIIMLERVAKEADFSRKSSSISLQLERKNSRIDLTKKRGVGISVGYNGNNYISNNKNLIGHYLVLKLDRDGKVDLKVNCRIRNLELLTAWENIICSILDIEGDKITFHTDHIPEDIKSSPNLENKNVSFLTPLLKQCCEEIKVRRFKDPLPIIQTKAGRRTSSLIWNPTNWKGEPFKNSSYGTCVIEVELDKRSLLLNIKEIWLQLEVGQIIHRPTLISSIRRDILSSIRWIQNIEPLFENGQFVSSDKNNRSINKIKPKINISFYEENKSKSKPKSIGSLIKSLIPGAYMQGVNMALGSNLNSFPVTKEIVFKELKRYEN